MRIIINGAGQIGAHLAKLFYREGAEVTVIDFDEERLGKLAASLDVETIHAEPVSVRALRQAGVKKADLFISVMPYVAQEVNVTAAAFAKAMGAGKVIARIQDTELRSSDSKSVMKQLGIDLPFCPERIAADEVVEILTHNSTIDAMDFAGGKLQISAFRLGEESPLLDITLQEFIKSLPEGAASNFRLIAISRDKETIIPNIDTHFHYGDLVYTISKKESIGSLTRQLGVRGVDIDSAMIMGGGTVGYLTARKLQPLMHNVKVVEIDHERCLQLTEGLEDSVLVVNGDGRNTDFLLEESIRNYDSFVALTGSDETNILACVAAKKFGVQRTIAQVENLEYMKLAEDMGVDSIINKKIISAGRVFRFTLSDKAKFVRYMSGTDAEVLEYTVSEGSRITRGALKDLKFPKEAVIGGVIRGDESFIAVGNTTIQAGDKVAVFALPEASSDIDKFFK